MKNKFYPHNIFLPLILFVLAVSPSIDAKKKSSPAAAKIETKAPEGKKSGAPTFQLRPLEVVEPNFFTKGAETQSGEGAEATSLNPTFTKLPHYKDNEFAAQRKKDSIREKWLGR